MAEDGRDLQRPSGPTPLLKQGHLQPVAQDRVWTAFENLQGWRLHKLPGQRVPVLSHPRSEKVFPDVQMECPVFQCAPISSGPASLGTPGKSLAPSSAFPPFRYLYALLEIPLSLLFSRLNSPTSVSTYSYETCSVPSSSS